MLQQFTWQQFLVAALILSLVWYMAIVLLYFREELKNLFKGGNKHDYPKERLPRDWESELEDESDDLMGEPVKPEGVSTVSTSDFSFGSKQEALKESQLGLIPDVMEELKGIFRILEKEDGDKSDFFSLLKLVKAKYPKINSNPNIDYLNDFIRERVPFLLTTEELENMWD